MGDIDESVRSKVYTQEYGKKPAIDGVQSISVAHHVGEDSDFVELMRLTTDGHMEGLPSFQVRQISRSLQYPGAIKAWHLHVVQDELWFVPQESHLLVGLWDVRKDSSTKGAVSRIILGKMASSLLFIPHGVAHGSANLSGESVPIIYAVNQQFNPKTPDEHRIAWDAHGADFWKPQRD
ncbi:dTDP-4-dehydrorhamnose 3,5-epimerase family protein [Candidatus Gottesmanbacteria bacterium]|nr:dTDP-4-dehydrorhamnose 3,5-epimerase family protein [Candidatus Gottesmanbacteria bacterium]